jgi:hypothetical protein
MSSVRKLVVAVLILGILVAAGCGSSTPTLVGNTYILKVPTGGQVTLSFKEDGKLTAVVEESGSAPITSSLTYTVKGDTVTLVNKEGTMTLTLSKDGKTLKDEKNQFTYNKQ